jgi:hypothetical protein
MIMLQLSNNSLRSLSRSGLSRRRPLSLFFVSSGLSHAPFHEMGAERSLILMGLAGFT